MGYIQQTRSNGISGGLLFLLMFFLTVSVTNGQTKSLGASDSANYILAFTPNHSSQHTEIKVSLDFQNLMLSKALLKLAKNANVGLSFDRAIIPKKKISYHCHKKALYDALHDLLTGTDLTFTISDDRETIIIQDKPPAIQTSTISGTVTDAGTGMPLFGVNILVIGTSAGTTTDIDGRYRLKVPDNADSLRFSYIGYQTKTVAIDERTTINVQLKPTVISGNQLVVIGYGKQKKKDITGAISSVSGKQIEDIPVSSVVSALQGKVAGVQIINSSGKPNSSPSIIIRGASSLHQPNPLYIVNGVRISANHIGNINPQNIKSISVLKDASAAAIYGAGAAGGVVIIETKQGSPGKISVAFNARYGISQPKVMDLLDKKHYIKLENIIHPKYFDNADRLDTLANTDWTDALYKRGITQKYNLAISGGNDVATYRFSGFYNGIDGVYIKNHSKHYGFKISSNYQIFDFLKIGEHLNISQRSWRPTPTNTNLSYHNPPFRTLPIIPVRNKRGGWGTLPAGYSPLQFSGANPVGGVKTAHPNYLENNVRGVVYATVDIPKNLTLKVHLSYASYHTMKDYFQEPYDFGDVTLGHNYLSKTSVESSQLLDNVVLSYDKDLFGKHHIHAMIGFEQIKRTYNRVHANETSIGLPGRSFIRTSNTETSASGKYDPNYLVKSEFGRVKYNYDQRYYISGSLRQDANFTKFGPNNKRALFGAVSVAWNISNEDFFKPLLPIINELKFRGSYGSIGNSNIGSYNYLATYHLLYGAGGSAIAGQNYAPGAPLIIGNTVSALPNPSLHWERDYEIDVGVDGTLLSGKLIFSVDWYKRTTKGMLYALPMALSSGYSDSYETNIGEVTSKGTDFTIGFNNHTQDFSYNIRFTGSFNHNIVNNLGGITNSSIMDGVNYYYLKNDTYGIMVGQNLTITKAGHPFGSFYGYKVLGLFPTQKAADNYKDKNGHKIQPKAHAGDLKFADTNGDGQITAADKQIIGNPNPKFTYGLNINLHWKDFELSMNWNGIAGVDIFNGVKAYAQSVFSDGNTTSQVFNDSFFNGNKLTDQPRLGVKKKNGTFIMDPNGNYSKVSSYFVEDGSYIKLKNIELGYNFSSTLLENLGISRAKIYVVAHNLLTITGYSGIDPELGSAYSAAAQTGAVSSNAIAVTTRGIDLVTMYPHIKTYSIGFNIKF